MPKEEQGRNNINKCSNNQETDAGTSNAVNNNNGGAVDMETGDNEDDDIGGTGEESGGMQNNNGGGTGGSDDNMNNQAKLPPEIFRTNRKTYKVHTWTLSGSSKNVDKIAFDEFCKEVVKVTNRPDTK